MAKQAISYFRGDIVHVGLVKSQPSFYYSDSCIEIKWSYPTVLDTIAYRNSKAVHGDCETATQACVGSRGPVGRYAVIGCNLQLHE